MLILLIFESPLKDKKVGIFADTKFFDRFCKLWLIAANEKCLDSSFQVSVDHQYYKLHRKQSVLPTTLLAPKSKKMQSQVNEEGVETTSVTLRFEFNRCLAKRSADAVAFILDDLSTKTKPIRTFLTSDTSWVLDFHHRISILVIHCTWPMISEAEESILQFQRIFDHQQTIFHPPRSLFSDRIWARALDH